MTAAVHRRGAARRGRPILVAIAGGSGSGKTWLVSRLQAALGEQAQRLALDDFYRDRSHLSPARRARVNFDHPRAIDWGTFERVLRRLRSGRSARVPRYDFATHSREVKWQELVPGSILLVEGLWVLRRPALRRLFALRLFLECPAALRLRRRMARDLKSRGRSRASVAAQFRRTVEPMQSRYVSPQIRWADVILRGRVSASELRALEARLRQLLAAPGA